MRLDEIKSHFLYMSDMYKNIIAIGNDIDQRHSILTGSLLLEGMTIAGT